MALHMKTAPNARRALMLRLRQPSGMMGAVARGNLSLRQVTAMRLSTILLALAVGPCFLGAQGNERLESRGLPRDVAREATDLFNRTAALRAVGPTTIESEREIRGDVAVLHGPLTIAGHVAGRVL